MSKYQVLNEAAKYALAYVDELSWRRVFPTKEDLKELQRFSEVLPEQSTVPQEVVRQLHEFGSRNTVASNSGRYFGFVFGGTLPASMAAAWMAAAWDQNAAFTISSPVSAHLENIAGRWLLDLLELPEESAVGFVTGTTMANFCGVLAARYQICSRMGWDIRSRGINGTPPIRVIVGEEVHASMQRALLLAGFGLDNLIRIKTDNAGRILPDDFPELDSSTLVCLQAGNVNTGSLDPAKSICEKAREKDAWVHIDGAFGLWARTSPQKKHLAEGYDLADSWAVDLHKWLNVPYDSGVVICRDPTALQNALSVSGDCLPDSDQPDPYFYTPEMSRRARSIETWAALQSLGRTGLIDLIETCCAHARRFAMNLTKAGFNVLNEVNLNQVLVSFGDSKITDSIIKKIQEEGTCWCGGTIWKGQAAMRISVSSWMTTEEDVAKSSEAIIRIANLLLQRK